MHLKKCNDILSWKDLKSHFEVIYENKDKERKLEDKLRYLVAEKTHFQEYLNRFLEHRTGLRDIAPKELFKTLVSGTNLLQLDLKLQVTNTRPWWIRIE
jgi:hypothetical protein